MRNIVSAFALSQILIPHFQTSRSSPRPLSTQSKQAMTARENLLRLKEKLSALLENVDAARDYVSKCSAEAKEWKPELDAAEEAAVDVAEMGKQMQVSEIAELIA